MTPIKKPSQETIAARISLVGCIKGMKWSLDLKKGNPRKRYHQKLRVRALKGCTTSWGGQAMKSEYYTFFVTPFISPSFLGPKSTDMDYFHGNITLDIVTT